ncbi:MAG: flavin prenyltransferase UbiX [Desulfotignum sp.]|nr:flavin prenyltransferase UbiX [Desulfotignum sp.]
MTGSRTFVVAVTGASGVVYGVRLIKALLEQQMTVAAVLSNAGVKVLAHEMGYDPEIGFSRFLKAYGVQAEHLENLSVFSQDQIAAPPASGSFRHDGMVVVPCSMKTLAGAAAGYADNLITRACDVTLKERRPVILVPRETPMNLIHLENMVRLTRAGAVILPASPSFYSFPDTLDTLVDTVVARILDHLGVAQTLMPGWGE